MSIQYWDTSALIKRYHIEKGSNRVNDLFAEIESGGSKGIISYLGVLESLSAITRRKEEIKGDYRKVIKGMLTEIMDKFTIVPIDNYIMELAMKLVIKHNLRSLDSIHLATALMISQYVEKEVVFISSDSELLKAAKKEGFEIINPED